MCTRARDILCLSVCVFELSASARVIAKHTQTHTNTALTVLTCRQTLNAQVNDVRVEFLHVLRFIYVNHAQIYAHARIAGVSDGRAGRMLGERVLFVHSCFGSVSGVFAWSKWKKNGV